MRVWPPQLVGVFFIALVAPIFPGGIMSDEAVQQEAAEVQVEQAKEHVEAEAKTFSEAYVKQLREEAASYRVKLKEFEDADKSELQKAKEAAESALAELSATRAEAARLRVAAKHGIGEDHLDLLTGADEDELEARASKLASLIASKATGEPERKGAWAPFDPEEGKSPNTPLNGGGIENALKSALGIG